MDATASRAIRIDPNGVTQKDAKYTAKYTEADLGAARSTLQRIAVWAFPACLVLGLLVGVVVCIGGRTYVRGDSGQDSGQARFESVAAQENCGWQRLSFAAYDLEEAGE